jgi:SmpA / OmlA family
MRVVITFTGAVCVLYLIGCAAGMSSKMRNIDLGMQVHDVESVLGQPDGKRMIEDNVVWSYYSRTFTMEVTTTQERADFHVVFKEGKVVEYGAGEIRKADAPGKVVIIPIR